MAAIFAFAPIPTLGHALQLAQLLDMEQVSAPQIAPNGKAIVYSRARVNPMEDRLESALWAMDAEGGQQRRLTEGSGAVWSPDSKRIAFVRSTDHGSQVFVRWMDREGALTQLTYTDLKPSNLNWSPDGKSLAFVGTVARQPTWTISLPPRPNGAKWTAEPTVIDTWHHRLDRVGPMTGYKHIFIVPAEGGTPRQLTRGDWHVGANMSGLRRGDPLEWTPDGASIVFSADMAADHDTHYRRGAIHVVDIETGALRQISREPGYWGGQYAGLRASPDGKRVAFVGHLASRLNFPPQELRVAKVDGTDERVLAADLPGFVHSLHWTPDGRTVYYVVEKHGSLNLNAASLDGKLRTITSSAHVLSVDSVSDGGVAVGTRSTSDRPADVVRFKLANGGDMRWLTAVNEDALRAVDLGRVEEIWYDSTDRARVQGWIVHPPAFDAKQKYPLLLYIHGGPEGMFDCGFSFHFQEMAAAGYVVLYLNPRGSTGYGAAFSSAIDSAFPGRRDLDDLMHGVDHVVKRGYVDQERLYVAGGSAGGALTAWIVGHTDRFAAAASYFPVIDWISFAGTTDVAGWGYNRFHTDFWKDSQLWLDHSPLMYTPKVRTPTIVVTGENDLRTPLGQSEEFYAALKYHNVPTKLIVVKGEGHGVRSKPSNSMRSQLIMRKWFESWRRVEGAQGPAWVASGEQ